MHINILLSHREVNAAAELKNNGVEEQKEAPRAAVVEIEGSGKGQWRTLLLMYVGGKKLGVKQGCGEGLSGRGEGMSRDTEVRSSQWCREIKQGPVRSWKAPSLPLRNLDFILKPILGW